MGAKRPAWRDSQNVALLGSLHLPAPVAFSNRRRTRLKILYWDGSGLWVLSKRVEKGTFAWAKPGDGVGGKFALRVEALSMLMDGIDLRGARMRPWYERDYDKLTPFIAYT